MDQLLGRARTDRTRRRFFVLLAVSAVALMTVGVLAPAAGAHGTGITADCERVTAVKPMDTVRVRRADGTEQTTNVNGALTFTFPPPNAHGRVNGVYVTFEDGDKADVPVPACPATTTTTVPKSSTTTWMPASTSTSTSVPSSTSSTSTTSATGPTTSTTSGASGSSSTSSSTVGGLGSTSTTVHGAGGGGQATTTSLQVAGAGAGTSATTAGAKPVATAENGGANLPFTGVNLTLLWLGLAALGAGGALYVNTRRRSV